jgi:hypothetical protein
MRSVRSAKIMGAILGIGGLKMININLDDPNVIENFKALIELKHTELFSEEELQEMYDKQVEADKEKQED